MNGKGTEESVVFGPVPSRRLGRSIGINNIPPKHCTYSCVYCQLGRTHKLTVQRRTFYDPNRIMAETQEKLDLLKNPPDYLTFVADGEPTLDENLGNEIDLLEKTGIPVAVITNSTLIDREDVREDLKRADLVSVKIDTVDELIWEEINRPHSGIKLDAVLEGIRAFASAFSGRLITETMLVREINDSAEALQDTACFIESISPAASCISVPVRPPAEENVKVPDEETLARAYRIFTEHIANVEILAGHEPDEFAHTGNIKDEILRITAVHPMRERALRKLLKEAGSDWETVRDLIDNGKLVRTRYEDETFYLRKLENGSPSRC